MKWPFPIVILVLLMTSCADQTHLKKVDDAKVLLKDAFVAFKSGDNERAQLLSKEVLSLGVALEQDTLKGYALMNLCRTALRTKDEQTLNRYGAQLKTLSLGEDNLWKMFHVHLYAEWARMQGDYNSATMLYQESLRISKALDEKGTHAAEHYNLAMVQMAKGHLVQARDLVVRYYELMQEIAPNNDDIHGLIPLASLLLHKNDLLGAAEVAMGARRMFKENNIVPDPADEAPLLEVEEHYRTALSLPVQDSIKTRAALLTEQQLLKKYLFAP